MYFAFLTAFKKLLEHAQQKQNKKLIQLYL